jgi:N-methylhydantoinase A
LGEDSFLGGEMRLDHSAALAAVKEHVADPLEMNIDQAAVAILRIANAHMALALRAVSVERGRDPRDFCLVASGGAGPLHGCTLARELKIPTVIVPRLPGQFSAWGMLTCDLRQDYVQTLVRDYGAVSPEEIQSALTMLIDDGLAALGQEEKAKLSPTAVDCRLDLRYRGQEYTVTVPLSGTNFTAEDHQPVAARFHELHRLLYGHSAPEEALELVGVRVTVHRDIEKSRSVVAGASAWFEGSGSATAYAERRVYMGERHGFMDTPVYRRAELGPGTKLDGPAIIEELASTTVVLPNDQVEVVPSGELVIRIGEED